MTIDLGDLLTTLQSQRAAADGALGVFSLSLPLWLPDLHATAQGVIVGGTVLLVLGRLVLLGLDFRDRFRDQRPGFKSFPGERFDRDRTPEP